MKDIARYLMTEKRHSAAEFEDLEKDIPDNGTYVIFERDTEGDFIMKIAQVTGGAGALAKEIRKELFEDKTGWNQIHFKLALRLFGKRDALLLINHWEYSKLEGRAYSLSFSSDDIMKIKIMKQKILCHILENFSFAWQPTGCLIPRPSFARLGSEASVC